MKIRPNSDKLNKGETGFKVEIPAMAAFSVCAGTSSGG